MKFTELPLCDALMEGLDAMNFVEATPIQEQSIPVIIEQRDLIACAQTGTGKTAAFLLPLINNLQTKKHAENKVNAIIMAPTRELAQQIDQQMEGFSYFTPFSSVAVYGGNDAGAWEVQKRGLQQGAEVVIATPGRLLSHINLYDIDFSGVKYFILDEADRMLDMGFQDDIMNIEKLLPKDRQTIMFSATMPPKIKQLARGILDNPVEIIIDIARPPETILQSAYVCHERQKLEIVKQLFAAEQPKKVILFSGKKQKVKDIARTLKRMGISADEMHSDLTQDERNEVMHEFRNERIDVLVATDIVARGIDIDDISLVINFDVPYDVEDYVHRIGRTARAGDSGVAITFIGPEEQPLFKKIEEFLGKEVYKIPVPHDLGEAPEYNPEEQRRNAGRRPQRGAGRGPRGNQSRGRGGQQRSGGRQQRSGGRQQRSGGQARNQRQQGEGQSGSEGGQRRNEGGQRQSEGSQQSRRRSNRNRPNQGEGGQQGGQRSGRSNNRNRNNRRRSNNNPNNNPTSDN